MSEIKFDGNKLFEIRKQKKLSQEKLASAIGVTRQTIYLWESNQSLPDVEKVGKICKVLEIDLSDLVDGVNPINNSEDEYVKEDIKNKNSRKIIKRIIVFLILIFFCIYIIVFIIKFIRLNNILSKWDKLNESTNYYIKVSEYVTNKKEKNIVPLENNFYELYYKDGVSKKVLRDFKNTDIISIIVNDYNLKEKYVIDVKEKKFQIEKINEKDNDLKLTDIFQTNFNLNNKYVNYIYCLRLDFDILNKETYIVKFNNFLVEYINKENGFIEVEELIDSNFRETKRYYDIELDTDKDFEINLDDYTEIE